MLHSQSCRTDGPYCCQQQTREHELCQHYCPQLVRFVLVVTIPTHEHWYFLHVASTRLILGVFGKLLLLLFIIGCGSKDSLGLTSGQRFMTDLLVSSLMADGGLESALEVAFRKETQEIDEVKVLIPFIPMHNNMTEGKGFHLSAVLPHNRHVN